jgi:hypothetical protein
MNITVKLVAFLLLAPGASARLPYRTPLDATSASSFDGATASASVTLPVKQAQKLANKLSIQDCGLRSEPARVAGFTRLKENVVERNSTKGPFSDYGDYSKRALSKVPSELRDYKIAGRKDTHVLLTERYSAALGLETDGSTSRTIKELQNRVGPADIPQLLDAMPDSRYFKKVLISENLNPEDDWVTQTYFPDGFISSMAMTDGQLELYMAERNQYLRRDVLHEWSHQLRYQFWNHKLMKNFEDAVNLELVEWNPSIYATRGAGEQWAVLGERMLDYSGEDFLEACRKAPIRTTIWMQALRKCLTAVPEDNRSVDHEKYVARMQYVERTVFPKALKKLETLQTTGNTEFLREQAKGLLQYLKMNDWKSLTRNLALIVCLDRYSASA